MNEKTEPMNDDFLYDYHQPPRRAFSAALWARLEARPSAGSALRRPLRWALAALVVGGLLMAGLPAARAGLAEVLREIGGMVFNETDQYPGGTDGGETLAERTLTLAEARQALPFTFSLPTWAPEGYVLDEQSVAVLADPRFTLSYARLRWLSPEGTSYIYLMVDFNAGETTVGEVSVGPGSVETVQVNGQPAALVRGSWGYDTQVWGADDLMFLLWLRGELAYRMSGVEGEVSAEDLIRMAQSIP